MVTIEDVAKHACVSRMTVSRVINNKGYVGAETRRRVEAAIKELNYRPNILAKALVTKRTSIIAYVMIDISDPFHNLVKQGFESIAYHGRYTSMMCDVHSAMRQRDYFNMFREIIGFIIAIVLLVGFRFGKAVFVILFGDNFFASPIHIDFYFHFHHFLSLSYILIISH